jgi:hypothetical protein
MSGAIIEINTSVMRCFFVVYKIKEYKVANVKHKIVSCNIESYIESKNLAKIL